MVELSKLGAQIMARREQLRLTQQDVATIVGLSDATIRFIEKGKTGVSINNWLKVVHTVGLDINLTTKKMSNEARKSI
ncbi:MAG: helix-turn-helix domain-containing protein [Ferruginibacter sp.]|nr:helix-turn-helix domain-containing protein [Ferruginibacter sp.]